MILLPAIQGKYRNPDLVSRSDSLTSLWAKHAIERVRLLTYPVSITKRGGGDCRERTVVGRERALRERLAELKAGFGNFKVVMSKPGLTKLVNLW